MKRCTSAASRNLGRWRRIQHFLQKPAWPGSAFGHSRQIRARHLSLLCPYGRDRPDPYMLLRGFASPIAAEIRSASQGVSGNLSCGPAVPVFLSWVTKCGCSTWARPATKLCAVRWLRWRRAFSQGNASNTVSLPQQPASLTTTSRLQ